MAALRMRRWRERRIAARCIAALGVAAGRAAAALATFAALGVPAARLMFRAFGVSPPMRA